MHLDQISTFVAIIESGSFNKASTKLFLSQPTITHRINKLESELGISLLVRGKKEVQLTQEGEIFFNYAKDILQSFEDSLTKIKLLKSDQSINLGYGFSLKHFMLNNVINSITISNYNTCYYFKSLKDVDVISNLLENKIQIGFTRELLENDYLEFHLISNEPIYAVAGKKLGLKRYDRIPFKEIIDEDFIVPCKETLQNDFFISFLETNNANIKFRTNDVEIQKKLVIEGYGISYFPKESIIENLYNNSIVQLKIDELANISSPIYLVHRKDFYNNTLQNIFDLFPKSIYTKMGYNPNEKMIDSIEI